VLLAFERGDFKAHLVQHLGPLKDRPPFDRLARYILGSRPTQYCARLYEHEGNAPLRAELVEALRQMADPSERLRRLPTGIRRSVEAQVPGG